MVDGIGTGVFHEGGGRLGRGDQIRRQNPARKIVVLNIDHPDVEEFVECLTSRGEKSLGFD